MSKRQFHLLLIGAGCFLAANIGMWLGYYVVYLYLKG